MFSRDFGRQEGTKSKHIFEMQEGIQALRWSAACLLSALRRAHLSRGGQGFEAQGLPECWLLSSGRALPAFVRFTALLAVDCLQICPYLAF